MASSNLFFSLVFALSFVHLLAAPAPPPSDNDYNAAPAPAPSVSDYNAAPAPAPNDSDYNAAPAPAPSDSDYNAAPAPAPNDNEYNTDPLERCGFHAIYQLGDSMSDTGNLIREYPDIVFTRNPYGVSFFNKTATGRCSDGLLMIDFFALSAGVPLLDAYLNPNVSSRSGHGMNFAVAGSTALPTDILAQKKILAQVTNSSLSKQLDWMFSYFNTTCSQDKECSEKIKKSLFIVEIGGNDYNYALFQSKTMEDLETDLVPDVVQAIKDAVTRIIGLGAIRMIVPGNFPIGCFPIYLTGFRTNNSTAYDESHCLKDLNNFAKYHNEHLKQAIQQLQKENPNVTIVYGDFYQAFQWILHQINLIGFDATSVQKACCGIGGEYNFDPKKMCGAPGVPVCPHPDKYISFDGIHLTQKAYQYMSQWLIHDIFPKLQCPTDH